MEIHTTDEATIDTLRTMLLDNPKGGPGCDPSPARRVFVDGNGNLRYSTYDEDGLRHDYCIHLHEVR